MSGTIALLLLLGVIATMVLVAIARSLGVISNRRKGYQADGSVAGETAGGGRVSADDCASGGGGVDCGGGGGE